MPSDTTSPAHRKALVDRNEDLFIFDDYDKGIFNPPPKDVWAFSVSGPDQDRLTFVPAGAQPFIMLKKRPAPHLLPDGRDLFKVFESLSYARIEGLDYGDEYRRNRAKKVCLINPLVVTNKEWQELLTTDPDAGKYGLARFTLSAPDNKRKFMDVTMTKEDYFEACKIINRKKAEMLEQIRQEEREKRSGQYEQQESRGGGGGGQMESWTERTGQPDSHTKHLKQPEISMADRVKHRAGRVRDSQIT